MGTYKDAKGWLRPEEREALVKYARDVRYQEIPTIVNIGVEYGASLACLRAGAPHANIYGIDIDISKAVDNYYCKLVEADSGLFVREWVAESGLRHAFEWPIDVLFVDGDHTYEGVVRDLRWMKYVRAAGYAIFHDCYDYDDPSVVHKLVPGVNKAVQEWAEQNVFGRDYGTKLNPDASWVERDPVGTMRIFRRIS